jgi:hypothetical protein
MISPIAEPSAGAQSALARLASNDFSSSSVSIFGFILLFWTVPMAQLDRSARSVRTHYKSVYE